MNSLLGANQTPPDIEEPRLSKYFSGRDLPHRLLTLAEAEVIWLAGAVRLTTEVATEFARLQGVSRGDRIEPLKESHLIDKLLRLLGSNKRVSVDTVGEKLGLTRLAVE